MIDMERIDDDTEYTWTEEAEQFLDMLDRTNARIDALLAELDETRGHLANVQRFALLNRERLEAVETWQQLSRGD